MSKKVIIKRSSEIKKILQTGKYVNTSFFKIAYLPSSSPPNRWAILIGRRYGRAVERNRMKRRLREILRNIVPQLQSELDILVIPKRTAEEISFHLLKEKVHHSFQKAGLLLENANF